MKRVLSVLLAVVMVLGLSSVAFAIPVTRDTVCLGKSVIGGVAQLSNREVKDYNVNPGDKAFRAYLYVEDMGMLEHITRQDVEDYNLGIQVRATAGGSVISRNTAIQFDEYDKAYYVFEWVDHYPTVEPISYRALIYITIDGSRIENTEFVLSGTFENKMNNVYANQNYLYLGDYPGAVALADIPDIQADLGSGLSIWLNMSQGMKYYGWVTTEPKADDAAIRAQYPSINTIYTLKTVNMNALENRISFDKDTLQYVYVLDQNGQLVFLGTTDSKLPYHIKYFLSSRQLSTTSGGSSSSSSSSKGGGGGGGGGGGDRTTAPAQTASPLSAAAGKTAVQNAIKAAAPGGKKASASIKNASSVSLSVLKEMAAEAQKSGTELTVNFDQVTGSKVMLRLSINPALAKNDIDVTMSTDSAQAKKVQSIMAKWFSNATFVISCGQKGSFGQSVTIAAALPEKFNTANLKFYSYDSAKNKYTEITGIKYWIDNAGYLHITTEMAGDIVVSDGPLTKK
ncbi:MAG: hypothetical protein ACK5LX_03480 [Oscillospiraceae bacterium]